MLLKIQIYMDVTPCWLVTSSWHFKRTQCLRNICNYLPMNMASYCRRPESSTATFLQPSIQYCCHTDLQNTVLEVWEVKFWCYDQYLQLNNADMAL